MEIPVFVMIILILVAIGLIVAAFVAGIQYRKKVGEAQICAAETKAREIIDDALKSADSKKREILLEAKGFSDVVVSINGNAVDVVVNALELTDAQRAQIEDIVTRKTDIAAENIIISTIVQ